MRSQGSPVRAGSLGRVIQGFKSSTTKAYIYDVKQDGWQPFYRRLWQRNYYERVVRNEEELHHIREYVVSNPARWDVDRENPDAASRAATVVWEG